jgi:hypothetical protein
MLATTVLFGIHSALAQTVSHLKEASSFLWQQAIPQAASDKLLELANLCVKIALGVAVVIMVAVFLLVLRLSRSQKGAQQREESGSASHRKRQSHNKARAA